MEVSEIRNKIRERIEQLPAEKLVVVLNLLEDLQQSEEDLTQALLNDPEFMEDYREAKEDIRTRQTVSLQTMEHDE